MEDSNRLLQIKLDQEVVSNLIKIGSLQEEVMGKMFIHVVVLVAFFLLAVSIPVLQRDLINSQAKIECLANKLDNGMAKDKVSVLELGGNNGTLSTTMKFTLFISYFLTADSKSLQVALHSIPRLVAQVEQALLPDQLVFGQPVVSRERATVPADIIILPSAVGKSPAVVSNLPDAAMINNNVVCNDSVSTRNATNVRFGGDQCEANVDDDIDTGVDSDSSDTLIPESWIQFR